MVRRGEALQKFAADALEVGTTEILEQSHPSQSLLPGLQNIRASRTTERKILVLERKLGRATQSRLLQIVAQLAAHVKVIAAGGQRILCIGGEDGGRALAERLVAEEVIDFNANEPTAGPQVRCPSRKGGSQIGEIGRTESAPDQIDGRIQFKRGSQVGLDKGGIGKVACASRCEEFIDHVDADDTRAPAGEFLGLVTGSAAQIENGEVFERWEGFINLCPRAAIVLALVFVCETHEFLSEPDGSKGQRCGPVRGDGAG